MSEIPGRLLYGGNSDYSLIDAKDNFLKPALSSFALCTTPIELLSNDDKGDVISRGTGFFWKGEAYDYVVTNFHVLSGRNPFTLDCISRKAYLPRKIRFYIPVYSEEGERIRISRRGFISEVHGDASALYETPIEVDGEPVDIVCIPIPKGIVVQREIKRKAFPRSESLSGFLNEQRYARIETSPGDDCFILGYPIGNFTGMMPPIWKRGSLASEPLIGVDGRPIFLIDAATTPSMSGSPILRRITSHTSIDSEDDDNWVHQNHLYELIGIYAGRLQNKEMENTNIGYGWYRTIIEQVVYSTKAKISTNHE